MARSLRLRPGRRQWAIGVVSLGLATLAVAGLQAWLGVPNASVIYLVAVVLTAIAVGTAGAVVAAVGSFLLYNFFFVQPLHTFTVADTGELLNLILLLFVGVVVGQLAALERARSVTAATREREARSLFRVSRDLATRTSALAVLPAIAEALRKETGRDRIWLTLRSGPAGERVVADTSASSALPAADHGRVLRRAPGDEPARWEDEQTTSNVVVPPAVVPTGRVVVHRVEIEAAGDIIGSLCTATVGAAGDPGPAETRLLSAAADQVGQAIAHDELAGRLQAAEVVRQSDALKSALLQAVSHDLRTPLATIRAAAGSLRPGVPLADSDRSANVDAIEREVEYLNRLVTNLLDLGRIETGVLRADHDTFELEDLLGPALERARQRLGERSLVVKLEAPPVSADPVLLDEVLTNVLENATKYSAHDATVRVAAQGEPGGRVRLTVDDSGPGVPSTALPLLFDKFYRAPDAPRSSRSGTGIGLAVVRGLVDAMGGTVAARHSDLGGLAIDIELQAADLPSGARS